METADTSVMTYGIVGLDSANVLAWFHDEGQAFAAAHRMIDEDPTAIDSIGLLRFDARGYPDRALRGTDLRDARAFPSTDTEISQLEG